MYSCQDWNRKIDNTMCIYELLTDYENIGFCWNLLDGHIKPKISPFLGNIYSINIKTILSQRFTDNEFCTHADIASTKWTGSDHGFVSVGMW